MLKQYDTDESGYISRIELTTILDTLGSTLKESTIDSFFERFSYRNSSKESWDLSMDKAVICLEDQLHVESKQSMTDKVKDMLLDSTIMKNSIPPILTGAKTETPPSSSPSLVSTGLSTPVESATMLVKEQPLAGMETQHVSDFDNARKESECLNPDDLNDRSKERVVMINECPIYYQPRLNKQSDIDIITYIATCASQDFRKINNIVMAGFITSSQAQRK
jgi:phosphatidylserine decarboxylase